MALIKRTFLEVRPVEIGKIKIGTRGRARQSSSGTTTYLPEKLDHFLVTTLDREQGDGPFMRDEAVHAIVGDQPRELFGRLMYPTVEENLHTEMCVYKGRRRQWTCDGEERTLRDGKVEPCQREAAKGCGCKPYARLHIQLEAQPQMGVFYVFRTHGWSSTNNLQTALEEIYREFGTLYRAPVRLFMQLTEDQYEHNGEDRSSKSWKVGISLTMGPLEAREYLTTQAHAALKARQHLQLEAGAVIADLDADDLAHEGELADEFAPPQGVAASVAVAEALDGAVAHLAASNGSEGDSEEIEVEVVGPELGPEVAPELALDEPSLKKRVEDLVQRALEGKKITHKQFDRCVEALEAGDEENLRITENWLQERLNGGDDG